jgi:hypothetical protein
MFNRTGEDFGAIYLRKVWNRCFSLLGLGIAIANSLTGQGDFTNWSTICNPTEQAQLRSLDLYMATTHRHIGDISLDESASESETTHSGLGLAEASPARRALTWFGVSASWDRRVHLSRSSCDHVSSCSFGFINQQSSSIFFSEQTSNQPQTDCLCICSSFQVRVRFWTRVKIPLIWASA